MTKPSKIDHRARLAELETAKTEAERLYREAQTQLAGGTGSPETVRSRREALDAITDEIAGVHELLRIEVEREDEAAANDRQKERSNAHATCVRELESRLAEALAIMKAIEALADRIKAYDAHTAAAHGAVDPYLPRGERIDLRENLFPPSFHTDSELISCELQKAGCTHGGNGSMGSMGNHSFIGWVRARNERVLGLIGSLIASATSDERKHGD